MSEHFRLSLNSFTENFQGGVDKQKYNKLFSSCEYSKYMLKLAEQLIKDSILVFLLTGPYKALLSGQHSSSKSHCLEKCKFKNLLS